MKTKKQDIKLAQSNIENSSQAMQIKTKKSSQILT